MARIAIYIGIAIVVAYLAGARIGTLTARVGI